MKKLLQISLYLSFSFTLPIGILTEIIGWNRLIVRTEQVISFRGRSPRRRLGPFRKIQSMLVLLKAAENQNKAASLFRLKTSASKIKTIFQSQQHKFLHFNHLLIRQLKSGQADIVYPDPLPSCLS